MGDSLTHIIQQHTGVQPLFLHGGLSRKMRDELVDSFQHKPYHKVFILSLKASGTDPEKRGLVNFPIRN